MASVMTQMKGGGESEPRATRGGSTWDTQMIGDDIRKRAEEHWGTLEWNEILGIGKCGEGEYDGDDMSTRSNTTGLRMRILNMQNGLNTDEEMHTALVHMSGDAPVDVMILQEAGDMTKYKHRWEQQAEAVGCQLIVKKKVKEGPTTAVILGPAWRKVLHSARQINDKWGDRAISLVFQNKKQGNEVVEKLMVIAVYGFANDNDKKHKYPSLLKDVGALVSKFRKANKKATVMVVGDLNVYMDERLDTTGEAEESRMGPWAKYLQEFEKMGLHDVFRKRHPNLKAVTRRGQGDQVHKGTRIDHVLMTKQAALHQFTSVGIHREAAVQSDHVPVVVDIPLNIAGLATEVCPIWQPTVEWILGRKHDVTDEEVDNFRKKWKDTSQRMYSATTHNERGEFLMQALRDAAIGTVAELIKVEYPRFVRNKSMFTSMDYKLHTWMTRMKGLRQAIQQGNEVGLGKAVRRGRWTHKEEPPLEVDLLRDMNEGMAQEKAAEVLRRLEGNIVKVKDHLKKSKLKKRHEKGKEMRGKRNKAFESSKTIGRAFKSVFKTYRKRESMQWVYRKDGSVASTPEEVGKELQGRMLNWFRSQLRITDRWESWEGMMTLDPNRLAEGSKEEWGQMVQECYKELMEESGEEWSKSLRDKIGSEETWEVIRTGKDSAAGKSGIGNKILGLLGKDQIQPLVDFYNVCLEKGEIPDSINHAMITLLPKTEDGLANVDKTRPINLMENVVKVYERIIMNRIVGGLMRHNKIDLSQYGGLPRAGCAPPKRIFAEVMDDAREAGKPLHLFVTDLSKAFDSMEYWSQAMSWRAMGLQEHMVKVLVNMDSGSGAGIWDEYDETKGATSQIMTSHGHKSDPFKHGRGVRQGSCGGPIKWIVFVNAWLRWIKKKMKGKGYRMSGAEQRSIKTGSTEEIVEVIASLFIDDAMWVTDRAQHMQEMVRMHEKWCAFHAVYLNKEKCTYMAINTEVDYPITWAEKEKTEDGHSKMERGRPVHLRVQRTGALGKPFKGDGRYVKYLGVEYEAVRGWRRQTEVLSRKLSTNLKLVKEAKLTAQQAVRMINGKVIPMMRYVMDVAVIPKQVLKRWDTQCREVIRDCGSYPLSMPTEVYHMPVEENGLGLVSLKQEYAQIKITSDLMARNDVEWDKTKGKQQSLQSKVVESAWKRHATKNTQGTGCAAVEAALAHIRGAIKKTPSTHGHANVTREDLRQATETKRRGEVYGYSDGSTKLERDVSTAATVLMVNGEVVDVEDMVIPGNANNYAAECWGALLTLRNVNVEDDLRMYIDNQGVILNATKERDKAPRERMQESARPIMNRIRSLLKHRKARGARTTMEWIHSHVDDEKRSKVKGGTMACACGNKQKCDEHHEHHVGNALADEAAEMAYGTSRRKGCHWQDTSGEEPWHICIRGKAITGDIVKAVKEQMVSESWSHMAANGADHAARYATMRMHASDTVFRAVAKSSRTSQRFKVRAWTDSLPIHKNEYNKWDRDETNKYYQKYGEAIQEGACKVCAQQGVKETMQHMLQECSAYADLRAEVRQRVRRMWRKKKMDKEFENLDWIFKTGEENQQPREGGWWRWLGAVPKSVMEQVAQLGGKKARVATSLVNGTAYEMEKYAQAVWVRRNAEVTEWEKVQGITKRVPERKQPKQGQRQKRGRPRKDILEVAESYRRKKEKQNMQEEYPDQWEERLAICKRQRDEEEQRKIDRRVAGDITAMATKDRHRWRKMPEKGKRTAAPMQDAERARKMRSSRIDIRKGEYPAVQASEWDVSKEQVLIGNPKGTKAGGQGHLDDDMMAAFRCREGEAKCGVRGCERRSKSPAIGCVKRPQSMRCAQHWGMPCRGGDVDCRCRVPQGGEGGGKERGRRGNKREHEEEAKEAGYIVKAIIGWHKGDPGEEGEYLVAWEGYENTEEATTWEKASNMDCEEKVHEYHNGKAQDNTRKRLQRERRNTADMLQVGDEVVVGQQQGRVARVEKRKWGKCVVIECVHEITVRQEECTRREKDKLQGAGAQEKIKWRGIEMAMQQEGGGEKERWWILNRAWEIEVKTWQGGEPVMAQCDATRTIAKAQQRREVQEQRRRQLENVAKKTLREMAGRRKEHTRDKRTKRQLVRDIMATDEKEGAAEHGEEDQPGRHSGDQGRESDDKAEGRRGEKRRHTQPEEQDVALKEGEGQRRQERTRERGQGSERGPSNGCGPEGQRREEEGERRKLERILRRETRRTIDCIAKSCGLVIHGRDKHKAAAVLAAYADRKDKQGDRVAVNAIRNAAVGKQGQREEEDGGVKRQEQRLGGHGEEGGKGKRKRDEEGHRGEEDGRKREGRMEENEQRGGGGAEGLGICARMG